MYLIRDVLNCKPGKVGELRKMFKALNGVMERTAFKRFPLITDVCGAPFWTLVAETETGILDDFGDQRRRKVNLGSVGLYGTGTLRPVAPLRR
jgi:hypothetical protein